MVSSSDAVLTSAAAVAAGLIAFFATWNAVSAQSLGDADQEAKTSKRTAKRIGGVECCADAFDRKVRNRVGQKQEDPSFWRWLLRQCSVGGFDTSKVKHQDGRQGATGGVKSADSQAERGLLAAIGNTPLVRINSLSEATGCEILGKSEFLNPGGSVKDRVAVKIIQEGLASGQLRRGGLVCEGSAGSTGVSLALVARAFGCRCFVALPDDAAVEKSQMLEALGAEVARVRPVAITHPGHFVNVARRKAEEAGGKGRSLGTVQEGVVGDNGDSAGRSAVVGMRQAPGCEVGRGEEGIGKGGCSAEDLRSSRDETTAAFSNEGKAETVGVQEFAKLGQPAEIVSKSNGRGQQKPRRNREEARRVQMATEGLTPKQLRKLKKKEAAAGREMVVSRMGGRDDVAQAALAVETGGSEGESALGDSWFDDLLGMEEETGASVSSGEGVSELHSERTEIPKAVRAREPTDAMPDGHAYGTWEESPEDTENGEGAGTGEHSDGALTTANGPMTSAKQKMDGEDETRSAALGTAANGRVRPEGSGTEQEKARLQTLNDADVSDSGRERTSKEGALANGVGNGSADRVPAEGAAPWADVTASRALGTGVSNADSVSTACADDVANKPSRPSVSGGDASAEKEPRSLSASSEGAQVGVEAEGIPGVRFLTEDVRQLAPTHADVSQKVETVKKGNERKGSEREGLAGDGYSADQIASTSDLIADVSREAAPASESLDGRAESGTEGLAGGGFSADQIPSTSDVHADVSGEAAPASECHAGSAESGTEGLAGGGFLADQFENLANFRAHYEGTGPEIWAQTGGHVDAFVAGAGTGGTLAGVSCFLKDQNPGVKCFLVDPPGSGLFYKVTRGVMYTSQEAEGKRLRNPFDTITEGIGINRMTRNFEKARLDGAFRASDQEAVDMARHLLLHDGLFLGSSSAFNCIGAVRVARALGPGHTIVTILCDGGQRHLSKFHNPEYLAAHGLTPSEHGAIPPT